MHSNKNDRPSDHKVFVLGLDGFAIVYLPESGEIVSRVQMSPVVETCSDHVPPRTEH